MRVPSRLRAAAALALATSCGAVSGAASGAALPFDDTGHLYVSMWSADEIAVFAEGGEPIVRFSADGLDGPRGLAFHPERDELWVAAELGDALHVFDAEHRLLRTVRHPALDGPVGIAFAPRTDPGEGLEIHVGNSDGDEMLVFDEGGELLRRFADPSLRDPGCAAFLPDGTLFVANRLGGTMRPGGAVARFGADDAFAFDFAADGLASVMGVARDPNVPEDPLDDTLWVTSGAGTLGIHEFDASGNLLRSVLPGEVPGGGNLVPQGIAFTGDGRFFVVSFGDEVFEFDGDGRFLSRFPTGPGTSRSAAFGRCGAVCAGPQAEGESAAEAGSGGGSGAAGPLALWALACLIGARRASRGSGADVRRRAPGGRGRPFAGVRSGR